MKTTFKRLFLAVLAATFVIFGTIPAYASTTASIATESLITIIENDENTIKILEDEDGYIIGIGIFSNAEENAYIASMGIDQIPDIPRNGSWSRRFDFMSGTNLMWVSAEVQFTYTPAAGVNAANIHWAWFNRQHLLGSADRVQITSAGSSGRQAWVAVRCTATGQTGRADITVNGFGQVSFTTTNMR